MRYAILILFLLSCQQSSHERDSKTIKLDMEKDSAGKLSSFISGLEYIFLETNEKSVFGNINKIEIKKDKIYVFDRQVQKAVFVFDINGKYLFKVDRTGKGPGEYSTAEDFFVNDNGDIEVLDRMLKKLIVYDHTGLFKTEKRLPSVFEKFIKISDSEYLFYNNNNTTDGLSHNLYYYNFTQRELVPYVPINKKFENEYRGDLQNFEDIEGSIFFFHSFSNKIHVFNNLGLKDQYVLNFSDHWMAENLFIENSSVEILKIFNQGTKVTRINTLRFLLNDKMYFTYKFRNKTYHNFYDIKNNQLNAFNRLINDIDGILTPQPPISKYKDCLVYYMYAYEFAKLKESKHILKNGYKIQANDNPVIILGKLSK